jgi:hypothetical protein
VLGIVPCRTKLKCQRETSACPWPRQVAEALCEKGANPFLENGKQQTSIDLAISGRHTAVLRSLERRALFHDFLNMKVTKWSVQGAMHHEQHVFSCFIGRRNAIFRKACKESCVPET